MNEKNTTKKKIVTEIADWIYENPEKKLSENISVFCTKFQFTERTFWNYVKKAQKYNTERIQAQEKIRDKILDDQTKEAVKSAIIGRYELLKFYSDEINEYKKFKTDKEYKLKMVGKELILPTFQDSIKAGQEIAKIQGYYAQIKSSETDSKGNDLLKKIKVTMKLK